MGKMMNATDTKTVQRPEGRPLLAMLMTPDLKQALKAFEPGWQILTDGGLREAVRRHHLPHHVAQAPTAGLQEPLSFEPNSVEAVAA